MATQKIRAFLDTNVLLEYFDGKPELQHLFSEEIRERVAFAINGIVAQELLLSGVNDDELAALEHVEIVELGVTPSSPVLQAMLRDERNYSLHVNDILILATARSYDVLLTYDPELREASQSVLRSETPDEFLVELGAAA
jgi:predicted nucleic acid-binding protein